MNLSSHPRSSGVQLHVTSLPEGRLGPSAFEFVDWLAEAGQSWWQVLPLGPPDRMASPYRARSAFAAWRSLLADPAAPVVRRRGTRSSASATRSGSADWERAAGNRAVNDQVRFEREWSALRAHASCSRGAADRGHPDLYRARAAQITGLHPELFLEGLVAGAPPDAYSDVGQLWGNPLYDWPAHRRRHYRWWVERLRRTFEIFDVARLDHFRGFLAYWAVPGRRRATHPAATGAAARGARSSTPPGRSSASSRCSPRTWA